MKEDKLMSKMHVHLQLSDVHAMWWHQGVEQKTVLVQKERRLCKTNHSTHHNLLDALHTMWAGSSDLVNASTYHQLVKWWEAHQ